MEFLVLGFGLDSLRHVLADSEYRLVPSALAAAIEEDRRAGWRPLCVVATAGTTSVTSIDPLDEIARVCRAE